MQRLYEAVGWGYCVPCEGSGTRYGEHGEVDGEGNVETPSGPCFDCRALGVLFTDPAEVAEVALQLLLDERFPAFATEVRIAELVDTARLLAGAR